MVILLGTTRGWNEEPETDGRERLPVSSFREYLKTEATVSGGSKQGLERFWCQSFGLGI